VWLEVGGADMHSGGACFEVGLAERRRSSFEQSNPRASSTLEKDIAKMVDGTPNAVTLESVTKEK
jgi:hypothetical protein